MQLSAPTLPFDPLPSLPGASALPAALGQLSGPPGSADFKSLLSSATEAPSAGARPIAAGDSSTAGPVILSSQAAGGMVLSAANFQVAQPTFAGATAAPTLLTPAGRWLTGTVGTNQVTAGTASVTNPKISGDAESKNQDAEPRLTADSSSGPISGGKVPAIPLVIDPSAVMPAVSTATMQIAVTVSPGLTTTPASLGGAADSALASGAATQPGLNQNSVQGTVATGTAGISLPVVLIGAPAMATAGRLPQVFSLRSTAAGRGDATRGAGVTATSLNGRSTAARKVAENPTGQPSESPCAPNFTVASAQGDSSTSVPIEVSAPGLAGIVTAPGPRGESQPLAQAVVDSSVRGPTSFSASAGIAPGVAGDTTVSPSQVAGEVVVPPVFGASPSPAGAVTPDLGSSAPRVEGTPLASPDSGQPAVVNPVPVPLDPSLVGPGIIAAHSLNPTPENFAGSSIRVSEKSGSVEKSTQKKALVIDKELDGERVTAVGINAAKSVIPMSVSAPSSSATTPVNEAPSFSVAPLSFEGLLKDSAGTPPELDHTARRAVESAMAAVEHFANSDQKSVNLQFTVSGVDLAVRVELRGDNVHTTFRTDSPELRNALANEWQAVANGPTGQGAHRFADPVFMTPSGNSAAGSDFGTASQQRQSGSRQNQPLPPEFSGFRSSGLSADSSSESAVAKSPLVLPASPSLRLNTFA